MLLPIILLSFAAIWVPMFDPIVGQEIVIKSMNLSPVGAGVGGAIAGSNANSIQQQQQQHQHQQTKPQQQPQQNHQQQQQQQQQPQQQRQLQQRQPQQLHSQDPHLKSLTVFATNYDTIVDNNESNNHNNKLSNFKPSYNYNNNNNNNHYNSLSSNGNNHKRPAIQFETNFTPIRLPSLTPSLTHASLGSGVPLQQPVIMQYLPQTVQQSGVQYLQLIPTRPLIVPIGPYLTTGGAGTTPTTSSMADLLTHNNHIYHQAPPPPASLTTNTITADYGAHSSSSPLLGTVPAHATLGATPAAQLVEATSSVPYSGLHAYGQSLQPYRHYRFNREIKPKNLLSSMNLNLHEYLPYGHEAVHAAIGRGR